MRILLALAVLAFAAGAAAETTTFDIATYTAPSGWEAKAGSDAVIYVKNASAGTACLVSVLKSHDAVAASFPAEYAPTWKTVLGMMGATAVPPPAKPVKAKSGDVDFLSGSALTTLNGKPVIVMLFLLDGGAKVMPVVAVTSTKEALEKMCLPGISGILDDVKVQKIPRAAPAKKK